MPGWPDRLFSTENITLMIKSGQSDFNLFARPYSTAKRPSLNPLPILILATVGCALITIFARTENLRSVNSLSRTGRQNIKSAFATIPDRRTWRRCFQLAAIYGLVAFPLGVLTGFLRLDRLKGTWPKLLGVAAVLFVLPGVMEELVFRVILLPHPKEGVSSRRVLMSSIASLLAFVLYHPLNGFTLGHRARLLFTDWAFLLQAGLLGTACTAAYLVSGSIWPPVLIHWLPVTGWILYFGGARRVSRSKQWLETP